MAGPSPGRAGPTSVRSSRVSAVRGLQQRSIREDRRAFLVEGPQAVREALALPEAVLELYLTPSAAADYPEWAGRAVVVPPNVLAAMSETKRPQGIVAVCRFIDAPLSGALTGGFALAAFLWQVRDPGNAGTVLRTADAAGAGAVLFGAESVDLYNGKCVRASAGSLFHVPVVREVDPAEGIEALRAAGFAVLAADGRAAVSLYDLLPTSGGSGLLAGSIAWVFGNEARGLDPAIRKAADVAVRIPSAGGAESLNLAAAAAVCLTTTAAAQRGWVLRPA